jgi:hypothetical protein
LIFYISKIEDIMTINKRIYYSIMIRKATTWKMEKTNEYDEPKNGKNIL